MTKSESAISQTEWGHGQAMTFQRKVLHILPSNSKSQDIHEYITLPILDTWQKKNLCWLVDIPIDTKRLKD